MYWHGKAIAVFSHLRVFHIQQILSTNTLFSPGILIEITEPEHNRNWSTGTLNASPLDISSFTSPKDDGPDRTITLGSFGIPNYHNLGTTVWIQGRRSGPEHHPSIAPGTTVWIQGRRSGPEHHPSIAPALPQGTTVWTGGITL